MARRKGVASDSEMGSAIPDNTSQKEQADESRPKTPTHEDIARLAYAIYVGNGSRDGHNEQDWLEAEHRLTSGEPNDMPRQRDANNPQDDRPSGAREPGTVRVRAE
jgi:Protein of unknown function (DUF2934)